MTIKCSFPLDEAIRIGSREPCIPQGEESLMAEENEINQQEKRRRWRGENPGKYSFP